jgi:hypothetical protein
MATAAKQAPKTITLDDWISAIAETNATLIDDDPAVLSYAEFQAMMQVAYGTARTRLKALVDSGRATPTKKRALMADGSVRTVLAFRLKQP